MLGLVTDAQAPFLAPEHAAGYSNLEQITLLSGNYRVPERARTILRGAILDHEAAGPGQSRLARPGTGPTSPDRGE